MTLLIAIESMGYRALQACLNHDPDQRTWFHGVPGPVSGASGMARLRWRVL